MEEDAPPPGLELFRTDYTGLLQEACEEYLGAAEVVATALAGSFASEAQAQLDRGLVRLVVAAHRATRLVHPSPDALLQLGLPRVVSGSADPTDPTIRVQDPARETWDFRPWLSEKLSHLRENLFALLETVTLALEAAPAEVSEPLVERARYELRASRNYASDILNAIRTMGLCIVDWQIDAGDR